MSCLLCHHNIVEDSRFTNYCSLTCYNIGTNELIQCTSKSKLETSIILVDSKPADTLIKRSNLNKLLPELPENDITKSKTKGKPFRLNKLIPEQSKNKTQGLLKITPFY